jgi:hypothetical protein
MKNTLLLFCILTFTINGYSQESPEQLINKFFEKFKNEGSSEALDFIFSTNKWISQSDENIEGIKSQLKTTLDQLGQYYDFESISKSSYGKNLVLHTFLIRYDRQPLRFMFLFYKPDNSWRLQNFSYDDNLDTELEEANKAYRLKENLPPY